QVRRIRARRRRRALPAQAFALGRAGEPVQVEGRADLVVRAADAALVEALLHRLAGDLRAQPGAALVVGAARLALVLLLLLRRRRAALAGREPGQREEGEDEARKTQPEGSLLGIGGRGLY